MPNSFEVTEITLTSGKKSQKLKSLRQVKSYLNKCSDNCSIGFLDYRNDNELKGFMFTMTVIADKLYFHGVEGDTPLYLLETHDRKLHMTEQKK